MRRRTASGQVAGRHRVRPPKLEEAAMNIDKAVVSFAGIMVLLSLVLAEIHSPYWLLLTAFVGLNLLQAGITGFCPAAMLFKKLGIRPGNAFR
jgi:hypothetical protein